MGAQKEDRCVIVSAGPMGDYTRIRQRAELTDKETVICVDGGLRHAEGLGLKPGLIIGDLDSVGEFTLPESVELKKFKSEKDETDMVLAIRQALTLGYKKILILGGLRGRLDHTYANFCALYELTKAGAEGVIIDEDNEVFFLPQGSIRVPRRQGFYISVFPFGSVAEGVYERGMKYSLTDATLTNDFPVGVSNEFTEESPFAEISVRKGPLLIILSRID